MAWNCISSAIRAKLASEYAQADAIMENFGVAATKLGGARWPAWTHNEVQAYIINPMIKDKFFPRLSLCGFTIPTKTPGLSAAVSYGAIDSNLSLPWAWRVTHWSDNTIDCDQFSPRECECLFGTDALSHKYAEISMGILVEATGLSATAIGAIIQKVKV